MNEAMQTMSEAEQHAYNMGRDCALNGANTKNCHFTLFSHREKTTAWEKGKKDAEEEKRQ